MKAWVAFLCRGSRVWWQIDFAERSLDHHAEDLERYGAYEEVIVDQERGSPGHADRIAGSNVASDFGLVQRALLCVAKLRHIESSSLRELLERAFVEFGFSRFVDRVVKLPK